MRKILLILCIALLLFSGYMVFQYLTDEQQAAEQFEGLAAFVEKPPAAPALPETPGTAPAPEWTVIDQYGALFEQNPDMIGWITIDGTLVDYPVMHTPDRPDYYLKRGFDKESSNYGVPYAAEHCSIDPRGDNVTIFGHHMKSGKMFGTLEKYKDREYWREHPVIRFDSRAGFGQYEIFAVFKVHPADFSYHLFSHAADEAEFDGYVRRCKALSFYDTGVTPVYGDKLIALSTCEYSEEGNRLVVAAKQIPS